MKKVAITLTQDDIDNLNELIDRLDSAMDVMDKDYEGKVALMDWCKELIDRFGKQHGIGFCDHYSTARLE